MRGVRDFTSGFLTAMVLLLISATAFGPFTEQDLTIITGLALIPSSVLLSLTEEE